MQVTIHHYQIKKCKGCHGKVAWVKHNGRALLLDVTDISGSLYLTVDTTQRHDCPNKELLTLLKARKAQMKKSV